MRHQGGQVTGTQHSLQQGLSHSHHVCGPAGERRREERLWEQGEHSAGNRSWKHPEQERWVKTHQTHRSRTEKGQRAAAQTAAADGRPGCMRQPHCWRRGGGLCTWSPACPVHTTRPTCLVVQPAFGQTPLGPPAPPPFLELPRSLFWDVLLREEA